MEKKWKTIFNVLDQEATAVYKLPYSNFSGEPEMKKKLILTTVLLLLFSVATQVALAKGGIIIISLQWPVTQNTPATFQISVSKPSDPTYDPQILLAMTVSCYNGLPEAPANAVDITWTGPPPGEVHFLKTDFELLHGNPPPKVPSDSDVQYTRSSLSDHLGEGGSTDVYWAIKDFPIAPDGKLHETAQTFVVTLHSTAPKMLVYAIGKTSETADKYNIWVPPTNPGFVVPEPATIAAVATSLGALGLYAYRRKRKP
jgi:hypothetical protein